MRRILALATIVALAGAFAGCMGPEEPAGGPGDDCPPADANNTGANDTGANDTGFNSSDDCPPADDGLDDGLNDTTVV